MFMISLQISDLGDTVAKGGSRTTIPPSGIVKSRKYNFLLAQKQIQSTIL